MKKIKLSSIYTLMVIVTLITTLPSNLEARSRGGSRTKQPVPVKHSDPDKIESVNGNSVTISSKESGTTQTFTADERTRITVNGATAQVGDIQGGMILVSKSDINKLLTRIEVRSGSSGDSNSNSKNKKK